VPVAGDEQGLLLVLFVLRFEHRKLLVQFLQLVMVFFFLSLPLQQNNVEGLLLVPDHFINLAMRQLTI